MNRICYWILCCIGLGDREEDEIPGCRCIKLSDRVLEEELRKLEDEIDLDDIMDRIHYE